jgi:hypothetical protein
MELCVRGGGGSSSSSSRMNMITIFKYAHNEVVQE